MFSYSFFFLHQQRCLLKSKRINNRSSKSCAWYLKRFSEGSVAKMEQALTPDVKILETGEVWTLDTIRSYFARPRPADFKRINTLDFFQTEVEGKMAFVSYHNTAAIHANGKDRMVKWLESAVLVKQGKSWRVKMLHSTRLKTK